ncbi:MAG TPA: PQQ-dependent sugar dehydrogenase [Actinomycetota bacterium]|nr:PQQ-dependent sugar dehydrogenase [Actinomycetota bacterium]
MRRRTNRLQLTLALVAVMALLAACSEDPTPAPAQSPSAPAPASATAPAPESPAAAPTPAAPLEGPPRLDSVGSFDQPIYVASPPGDQRIFVVEQEGRVVEMVDGRARTPAFIDIRNDVGCCGERGLFSIAFAPNFAESGLAYLSYTDRGGDSRIEEYRVDPSDPNRLDPGTRRLLIAQDQPFANHNGGLIAFDPTGMLMIGFGDGGSSGDPGNRAQNLGTWLGKLLRIDPGKPSEGRPYGIPPDNPFLGRDGARPEIWAYGLRNPWRWSFDPATGDFYLADVGQNRVEEVNFVPAGRQAGANYGWPRFEGNEEFRPEVSLDESALVRPVLTYRNAGGNCSVTGGGVYRGRVAQLRGMYLFGDYCGGVVQGFRIAGGRATGHQTFERMNTSGLSSFGEDSAGEMYVTSLRGDVYRITAG